MSSSGSRSAFPFRIEFPPELPISARAEEITAAIRDYPVLILAGETGSGKTTQIPKLCLAAGRGRHGRIGCTQPRRVAAQSISRRVAEEVGVAWGREVGCKIRFSDRTSAATVIKFLTDGMLLAEMHGDPLLREYDTIIIDEAHERSLNIDFLLGHLRQIRPRRPDLKIIITSATIDTDAFSAAFDGAPVVVVEGRTWPVEVVYAPLDELAAETSDVTASAPARAEAMHYVDGAVAAVERILRDSKEGDVLVFMPSERDIRETTALIEGRSIRRRDRPEVVPLFGRLSNAEQQRVFAASPHRKIIVATNIAETSLTIPGIHYVVDTGLARISRYAPQSRTRRLPIEPISRSSADQRRGRSGRVAHGICIRLYSEKDYLERPRFTQPEIQRANLADVILRMKAFGLGDIERFPFLNMPATKAIRAGYALLEELGALERTPAETDSHALTDLGRELSHLPVDPTVGRMILQARTEKALREVLIIAAGLSIQDPRERPLDRQTQADAAHRRFSHPDSDFLTLLAIWNSAHDQFDTMSQARLRAFCREHFLSYVRMREWRDIHGQLLESLEQRGSFRLTSVFDGAGARRSDNTRPQKRKAREAADPLAFGAPAYRAIHRSILAGLLGNVARLDPEKGNYEAAQGRRVVLFPGSTLFRRETRGPKDRSQKSTPKARKAPWIMAAEIVETTRLYARTCARLDPLWALELASHLVHVAHTEPFWDDARGRVMVRQRSRLYGLELASRAVSFGRIDSVAATDIFIREGLVNDTIRWPFDFLAHNREVRAAVESDLTRTRDRGYLDLDEATYRFYAARLLPRPESVEAAVSGVSSVPELVDLVRQRQGSDPRFLMMEAADLRDPATSQPDREAYPEAVKLENRVLPLAYAYRPGQTDDGVTLTVGVRDAEKLKPADLDWAVPGHLPGKVEFLLKSLPKDLRRAFVPLVETARGVTTQLIGRDRLTGRSENLFEALAAVLRERFKMGIDPRIWNDRPLPEHLRVRVRVVDNEGRELCSTRNLDEIEALLAELRQTASELVVAEEPEVWRRARRKWERESQNAWTFGDLPAAIEIGNQAGVPVLAYPGLRVGVEGVALRLFHSAAEARAATRAGVSALLELQVRHDLGWLQRDLRDLRQLGTAAADLISLPDLQEDAFQAIRRWICDPERVGEALTDANFTAAVAQARADLKGIVPRLTILLAEIFALRQELLVHGNPPPGLERDLEALLPPDFLRVTPFPQLQQFPRYLRAMKLRADRWRRNPAKDAERAALLAAYLKPEDLRNDAYRWLVEEFRVSLFAQELGTTEPVSAAKLDRLRRSLGSKREESTASPTPPAAIRPIPSEKKPPIKSLGALDRLFRK